MAAAHVSGAAMLALSACDLSTEQLKSLLLANVESGAGVLGRHVHRRTAQRAGGRAELPRLAGHRPDADTECACARCPRNDGDVDRGGRRRPGAPRDRFYVWDGSVWSLERPWSSVNTFPWTPTYANDSYRVAVNVRSAGNTASELGTSEAFAIKTGASSATLTSNIAPPRAPGNSRDVDGVGRGGAGSVQVPVPRVGRSGLVGRACLGLEQRVHVDAKRRRPRLPRRGAGAQRVEYRPQRECRSPNRLPSGRPPRASR